VFEIKYAQPQVRLRRDERVDEADYFLQVGRGASRAAVMMVQAKRGASEREEDGARYLGQGREASA
jgi:hypothetical protein